MERLSGLDASFLYIESLSQPQHVCSILEVDTSTMPGGYSFEGLHDELAVRIAAIPEFRAKLADTQLNLDYPVWVDDDGPTKQAATACAKWNPSPTTTRSSAALVFGQLSVASSAEDPSGIATGSQESPPS